MFRPTDLVNFDDVIASAEEFMPSIKKFDGFSFLFENFVRYDQSNTW
jgi:hypothetical protein